MLHGVTDMGITDWFKPKKPKERRKDLERRELFDVEAERAKAQDRFQETIRKYRQSNPLDDLTETVRIKSGKV